MRKVFFGLISGILCLSFSTIFAPQVNAATLLTNISEINNKGDFVVRSNIWYAWKFTAGSGATISSVTVDLNETESNYTYGTYVSTVIKFYADNSGAMGSQIGGQLGYTSTNAANGYTVYGTLNGNAITIPGSGNYWIGFAPPGGANNYIEMTGSTGYTGVAGWATYLGSNGIADYYSGASYFSSATYGVPLMTISGTETVDSTAPTIASISSDKASGSYKAGEIIDIDVTFSEAVTSTGNITITLETGDTDRTCTFAVSNITTGTCNYTVQAGDTSNDLEVSSVTGTIADQADNPMTDFVPASNLATNEAIIIDTTVPILSSISSDPDSDSAVISWTSDEASSSQIEYGLISTYGSTTSETDTSPRVLSHLVTLNSLKSCARYYYRVISSDTADNETISDASTFITAGCTASTITDGVESTITTSGGSLTFTNGTSTAQITAPNDFYSESVIFQINKLNSDSIPTAPTNTSLVNENFYDLIAVSLSGTQLNAFDEDVIFTVTYGSDTANSFDEETLDVYKYSGGIWVDQNCTPDTSLNTLTCTLTSFSVYALFGEAPETNSVSQPGMTPAGALVCKNSVFTAPDIYKTESLKNSVTLHFTTQELTNAFVVSYSEEPSAEKYAANISFINSHDHEFTVDFLRPSTTYYFKIYTQNGCMPGKWSEVKAATTTQGYMAENINTLTQDQIKINKIQTEGKEDTCKHEVIRGDNLWHIAKEYYGSGELYKEIVERNKVKYPNIEGILTIGWELVLNCKDHIASEAERNNQMAHDVTIQIRKDGVSLPGVSVELHSDIKTAVTNERGEVHFSDVAPGEHEIILAYENYKTSQKLAINGEQKEFNVSIDIELKKGLLTDRVWIAIVSIMGIVITALLFLLSEKK